MSSTPFEVEDRHSQSETAKMRVNSALLALSAFATLSLAQSTVGYSEAEIANGTALNDLAEIANSNLEEATASKRSTSSCSLSTANARLEW